MRCVNCLAICTDRDVEVNDGCCPYCGALVFEDDFDEEEQKLEKEEEFGDFDDEEDPLEDYDFSDIEVDDDDPLFDDDDEFDEDDIDFEDEEDY